MEKKTIEPTELTLYENSDFRVMESLDYFSTDMISKSYMKIVMDFVEELGWKTKYLLI